jgi:hypothetical protein
MWEICGVQVVRQNLPELLQLCGTRAQVTSGRVRELAQERKQNVPDTRDKFARDYRLETVLLKWYKWSTWLYFGTLYLVVSLTPPPTMISSRLDTPIVNLHALFLALIFRFVYFVPIFVPIFIIIPFSYLSIAVRFIHIFHSFFLNTVRWNRPLKVIPIFQYIHPEDVLTAQVSVVDCAFKKEEVRWL